ncbi:hypothetical protein Zm00014a_004563 [Zea mays]|jgi:hypothetical protein|uniref:Uncharacterized protein n=1 Tax=Zea mays TaxID=4577 RepID=A0A3L6E3D6_MAIZE|nr:hypothetical protein Zm00014a_004563 [Zea mays]
MVGKIPVPFTRFFRPFSDFSGYTENGTETGCVITKMVRDIYRPFSEFSGKSGIFPYFNRIFPVHK